MPRKPATLERIGGKSPRQRIWETLRAWEGDFTSDDIICKSEKVTDRQVIEYMTALIKGKYLAVSRTIPAGVQDRHYYRLVKNTGIEAPRLDKAGNPVKQGLGTEQMWRAMRIIGEFNSRELAGLASTPEHPVKETTAKEYVSLLFASGYLREVSPAFRGKTHRLARYTLQKINPTTKQPPGARPPMIQNTKAVYDPNLGKVVWQKPISEEALDA